MLKKRFLIGWRYESVVNIRNIIGLENTSSDIDMIYMRDMNSFVLWKVK